MELHIVNNRETNGLLFTAESQSNFGHPQAIYCRLIYHTTLKSADINIRNYVKEKIVRADIECV